MRDSFEILIDIVKKADGLEEQRRALLPAEVQTLKSAQFIRQIAPYLFGDELRETTTKLCD